MIGHLALVDRERAERERARERKHLDDGIGVGGGNILDGHSSRRTVCVFACMHARVFAYMHARVSVPRVRASVCAHVSSIVTPSVPP